MPKNFFEVSKCQANPTQHPTKSPKSSQLLVRQMVLDGHPKEDCIFQSTVPGSADGADKSRSHLWPPQAELLDELTGSLGLLLKKHKKVRSSVNLHTTPPTPSKNFPGTVAFHSMHLRCNLGYTRSNPPAIFEVLGAAQAQHSAASLAKVDQRS